jgi:hypothetical protein
VTDVTLAPPDPGGSRYSVGKGTSGRHRRLLRRRHRANGAQFLTEPLDRKAELRCYLREPDGYLIEVSQATGMLEGIFADIPATA